MSSDKHFEHAINIARDGLKALLLFNVGAAGALVALTDRTQNSKDYTFPILFFGCGAICSTITYVIGYLSQLSYANHCLQIEKKQSGAADLAKHNSLQSLIFKFVAVTLFFTLLGIGAAFVVARS